MLRIKTVKHSLPILALTGLFACASSPEATTANADEQAYQEAIAAAMEPASAEAIAAAERSDPLTRANFWSNEYQKNAADLNTTLSFMKALRALGSHDRVLEVASSAIALHPQSHELYLELGRSLLADNKPSEAAQAFARSADLSPPDDAAPLAALGLAFDRLEDHAKAQDAYQLALAREPNRVSTLSNYGLSLALTGRLSEAEEVLRKAVAEPSADVRVRQNLALILGLQGRFDEMSEVDPSAPRRTVEANRQVLRDMMLPARSYETLEPETSDTIETDPAQSAAQSGLRPKLRGAQGG